MNASSAAVAIAPPVPTGAMRAALHEAVGLWSSRARTETFPRDRLWIYFTCDACRASYQCVIQVASSPWIDGDPPPLYHDAAGVDALLERALSSRPVEVDEEEWTRATTCACRAPRHHQRAIGSALLHDVLGCGAAAIASRLGSVREWLRAPDGCGAFAPFDPASFESTFGRPLSLFDSWLELAPSLPPRTGSIAGVIAEPGVILFAAPDERALDAGIAAKIGLRPRFSVRIDPSIPATAAWPSSLRHAADDGVLALVVDRDTMLAQARAWARSRADGDVAERGDEWTFVCGRGEWPVVPGNVALLMARAGRTLAEACAHAIDEAVRAIDDRIATLTAMTELLPGSSFVVEGTRATARRADGAEGRSLDLDAIPAGAGSLSPEALAREAAFLFDVAPPWADRSKVCACGAAACLERRLTGWPLPDDRPWLLATWGDGAEPHAAEVIAICCDRHVRIPSERELRAIGVTDARAANATVSRPRVRVHRRGDIVFVRGPFISGIAVADARVRALHDAIGRPFGDRAIAWALGTEVLALAAPGTRDESIPPALGEAGIAIHGAFWIRREVDLNVAPLGSFDVVSE